MRRKRKGFTMVELMVVVIIMAVLGLAIIPSLMGSSEKAKYSRAWNDLNAIANAFTAFYGRVGNLPDVTTGELLNGKIPGSFTLPGSATAVNAEQLFQSFLGTPLADLWDPWGNRYQITSNWESATGRGYIVVWVLPSKDDGVSASFAGVSGITAKKDPYNGDKPMAKLVVNVM